MPLAWFVPFVRGRITENPMTFLKAKFFL